jgi:hypothetical protein
MQKDTCKKALTLLNTCKKSLTPLSGNFRTLENTSNLTLEDNQTQKFKPRGSFLSLLKETNT